MEGVGAGGAGEVLGPRDEGTRPPLVALTGVGGRSRGEEDADTAPLGIGDKGRGG